MSKEELNDFELEQQTMIENENKTENENNDSLFDGENIVKENPDDKKDRKKHKPMKGKSIGAQEENKDQYIDDITAKNLLILLPLDLVANDGADISTGHYKVVGRKLKDKIYLDFYQSAILIAKVPAIETNNDFGEMEINFAKKNNFYK